MSDNKLAKASIYDGLPPFGEGAGTFLLPYAADSDAAYRALGLAPEKLIVPKDYHQVLGMIYDFYQRGGIVATVINRLAELSITEIRNGQRKTTDEQNAYFEAVLHRQPSRLMRFLRVCALEYYLSGMIIPRVEFIDVPGRELHPKLNPNKMYTVPKFDLYPPNLVKVEWTGWGKKEFYLKVPSSDIRLIRNGGGKIKEQQNRYNLWLELYPSFVQQIQSGADSILLRDIDPILRKEVSYSPYPTPYLYNVLEPVIFRQQLRRMDFAVASRVINAILLVQEGNDNYPITEETRANLDDLKTQILARSNNPRLMERLFILFSNHTTKLQWVSPDVSAMLNQDKYRQVNEELSEGLGFSRILVTGEVRGTGGASEVSTWAIQPMMEELRSNLKEWITDLYEELSERNRFRNTPEPMFKPLRLQDFVKTAAVFSQLFKEGNLSRTTRTELLGADFETEVELMRDEVEIMGDLPPFPPMPYSPLPPGAMGQPNPINGQTPDATRTGRPLGTQDPPITERNTGINPSGQEPVSRVQQSQLSDDEEIVSRLIALGEERGINITTDVVESTPELFNE